MASIRKRGTKYHVQIRRKGYSIKMAWKRLVKRAGISDLHFHDLRHETISRFFERGLSVPEVATISGHRDFRMLYRYTHLKPEEIAKKLT